MRAIRTQQYILRAALWNKLDSVRKYKEIMTDINGFLVQNKNWIIETNTMLCIKICYQRKISRLEAAMKKRVDSLVELNEQLQKVVNHLLCKEFSEPMAEAGRVWRAVCMNDDPLLRSTRIRTLQIMIESMIEIRDLDQISKYLQHLRTIDTSSFDTEWLELYYLKAMNVEDEKIE
jgi:hypothetical protein